MFGYVIDWTAVGICLTALIAVWQLRQDSSQKAADRELETKRDILFDGVRGMSQAVQAFSAISDLNVPYAESVKLFQSGMSKITVSTSVASLAAAKAGKSFIDTLGPLFLEAMSNRAKIDGVRSSHDQSGLRSMHQQLAAFILGNLVELSKSMLRAIAAVRTDVGIAKESESEFLEAVFPNEPLLKSAMAKALGKVS